jgi:hypothetical protein
MDVIRPGFVDGADLVAQFGEISGEDRGGDADHEKMRVYEGISDDTKLLAGPK